VAVEIHDRQRPMDPSPVHTTPPVEEEDEWGMKLQFCPFLVWKVWIFIGFFAVLLFIWV